MSESLRITTVAEGIEDAEQAARMRDLGCTFGQGFFFARPMVGEAIAPSLPSADIVTDLAARRASGPRSLQRRRSGEPGTAVARYITAAGETGVA